MIEGNERGKTKKRLSRPETDRFWRDAMGENGRPLWGLKIFSPCKLRAAMREKNRDKGEKAYG